LSNSYTTGFSAQALKPHSSSVETTFSAVRPITSHTAMVVNAPGEMGGRGTIFFELAVEQQDRREQRDGDSKTDQGSE